VVGSVSRSVSPNGDYSAEHIRELCNGKFEVGLFIGPARSGVGAEYVGQTVFRSQSDRDEQYALSIKPFKLWWVGENKLHVEYPRREQFSLSGQIGKFELEIQRTE
jgi:hypothetical protein